MANEETGIDLSEVAAQVDKLSNQEIRDQLMTFRVRQKVQQKKHYNPEKMKAYQAKQREKFRAMKQRAIELGLWEQIEAAADARADELVAESTAPEAEE